MCVYIAKPLSSYALLIFSIYIITVLLSKFMYLHAFKLDFYLHNLYYFIYTNL